MIGLGFLPDDIGREGAYFHGNRLGVIANHPNGLTFYHDASGWRTLNLRDRALIWKAIQDHIALIKVTKRLTS